MLVLTDFGVSAAGGIHTQKEPWGLEVEGGVGGRVQGEMEGGEVAQERCLAFRSISITPCPLRL